MIPVRQYWNLLVDYLRPYRLRVVVLAVLLFTGIAFQLINPQIVRSFIDQAIEGADQSDLIRLALLFAVLAVGHQALSVVATYMAENIGWSATNELRGDLADHCLRLDMGFHKTRTPGEMIERVGAPMVYGVTIPDNCENREMAEAWVEILLSDKGRAIMEQNGQPAIVPATTAHLDNVPMRLRPFCRSMGNTP